MEITPELLFTQRYIKLDEKICDILLFHDI